MTTVLTVHTVVHTKQYNTCVSLTSCRSNKILHAIQCKTVEYIHAV